MVETCLTFPAVFIVDDDPSVRRCLLRMVSVAGMEARAFSSAEEFLGAACGPAVHPACLLLDLQMPGLGGLELQRRLAADPAHCPVVFVSGQGDIPATVQAMKQGAVTFLTKPFDQDDVLQAIREAIALHRRQLESVSRVRDLRDRIEALTEREREVMAWVITGALNKQIAGALGIVEQTVKVHRARVMEKMHAVSVAGLVRLCGAAGFEAAVP